MKTWDFGLEVIHTFYAISAKSKAAFVKLYIGIATPLTMAGSFPSSHVKGHVASCMAPMPGPTATPF